MNATPIRRGAALCALAAVSASVLGGCGSSSDPPGHPDANPVSVPPPDARGPVVETVADVRWDLPRPGCVTMEAPAPGGRTQLFRITGPPEQELLAQHDRGQRPAEQRLRVRGYVDTAQDTTVCGAYRAFVLGEAFPVR
ncbi:hypothetical protein [Amycolatopsis rubida]|uniref:Lipoprotein n=1 Tax=Amycolatopsis rubida TaxID=112413 RepID=A0A1I5XEZ4_9PSEU|nr:hypothetical protein [Amycolatopsis rubida]SFQ30386.1 hypothetical protein SAMN05421854_110184 [Amycolatopsis rubida]